MLFVLFGHIGEIKCINCCFSVKKTLLFNLGHRLNILQHLAFRIVAYYCSDTQ